jgi:hypothetical protein
MFKKLSSFLFFAAAATASHAQGPILTAANMNPYLGDIYVNTVCDTTGVAPGPSGGGQTWNFGGLVTSTTVTPATDTATAQACGVTPECALFNIGTVVSNIAIVAGGGTVTYVNAGASTYSETGYWLSAGQNVIYTDPLVLLRYPFTFGSTFSDPCAGIVTYTPSGSPTAVVATETSTVTTTADGYGTLILPPIPPSITNTTYTNVLRVHSTQQLRDSANVFGTPTVGTYQIESYNWYIPNYHSALLTITSAAGLYNYKAVSYSSYKLRTAVPDVHSISGSLELFPNPVRNELTMKFNVENGEPVHVSVMDMLGREVATVADKYMHGAQQIAYNTANFPAGLYVVRLQSGAETVTRKLLVQ